MPIPASVSHADLMAATEPLYRLLGLDPKRVYPSTLSLVGDEIHIGISPEDRKVTTPHSERIATGTIGVVAHLYLIKVVS